MRTKRLRCRPGLRDLHRQVEPQVADEGKGVGGVRGERGEDGLDGLGEVARQVVALDWVEPGDVADRDAQGEQSGAQLLLHQAGDQGLLGAQLLPAGRQLLGRGQAVRPGLLVAVLHLAAQAADALHGELVVDHAHDPGELDPLQQRLVARPPPGPGPGGRS